jgi:GPH family glycoside/pentoside/hexuronide:cation symporter
MPPRILLAYALPGLPLAVLTLPAYVYLPTFYAQELGLPFALVGQVLLLARLFDVAIDPLAGQLSDSWMTRWGRRRPWLIAALALVLPATWALFVPPAGAGAAHLLVWTLALYLGWTLQQLPYQAWAAELTPDYHQRARVTGMRELFVLGGLIVSLGLPLMLGGGMAAGLEALALLVCRWRPASS